MYSRNWGIARNCYYGCTNASKSTGSRNVFSTFTCRQAAKSLKTEDKDAFDNKHLYPSDGKYVQSDLSPRLGTDRPLPINVLMNRYKPLKHELTHEHKVADIQFRSFYTYNLDFYIDFALRAAFYLKIPVKGAVPLKSRTERWTVIKSPFVHAKSKENFQRITHRRLITLYDANPEVVEVFLSVLKKYSMPGIGIKANLYGREDLEVTKRLESVEIPEVVSESQNIEFNGVNLGAADPEVAKAVLEILSKSGAAEAEVKEVKAEGSEGKGKAKSKSKSKSKKNTETEGESESPAKLE